MERGERLDHINPSEQLPAEPVREQQPLTNTEESPSGRETSVIIPPTPEVEPPSEELGTTKESAVPLAEFRAEEIVNEISPDGLSGLEDRIGGLAERNN
jgi:hypothetical protein